MSDLRLITESFRLHFLLQKEQVCRYDYSNPAGFSALSLEGGRKVTAETEAGLPAVFSNLTWSDTGAALKAGDLELMGRRGTFSVGFRQTCVWSRNEVPIVQEIKTVRLAKSPCAGTALDIESQFSPLTDSASLSLQHRLVFRLASALYSENAQVSNSLFQEGASDISGRSARWCSAMGVLQGETAGAALLEHPDNPGAPNRFSLTEGGVLSVLSDLAVQKPVTLRYRILTFLAYVEAGWTEERWREFSRRTAGFAPQ